jgi:hypothetical protein
MRKYLSRAIASAVLTCAISSSAHAQYNTWGNGLSNRTTNAVIRILQGDFRECGELILVFRYDCYSQSYRSAADRLDGILEYAPAQDALRLVEDRIASVVSANIDRSRPPLRQGGSVFNAVKEEAIPQLRRETLGAMDEARTILLRSPTEAQRPHYSRIAAVIESNKVLLRSALLHIEPAARRVAGLFYRIWAG